VERHPLRVAWRCHDQKALKQSPGRLGGRGIRIVKPRGLHWPLVRGAARRCYNGNTI
jgi:hypothetical protein